MKRIFTTILPAMIFAIFISSSGYSQNSAIEFTPDIKILLQQLVDTHEEIKSFKFQVNSASAQLQQNWGQYYPAVDVFGDAGKERIEKEFSPNSTEERHNITLKASQLITDFGATTGAIDRAEVLLDQSKSRLESTTQRIMLEGITAYINIVRARERLKSSKYSEQRIKELAGIEKALVDKGAGLSTAVLQAKSQLSGAMAISVEAEGELRIAKNRFNAIFSHIPTPKEVENFKSIAFPSNLLPPDQEEAVNIAIKNNPELNIKIFILPKARLFRVRRKCRR